MENKSKLVVLVSVLLVSVLMIGVVALAQTPTGQGELKTVSYNDELFRVNVDNSDFSSTEIAYGELVELLFENVDMGNMDVINHIAEINSKYADVEVVDPRIMKTSQFVNVGNENNQYIVEVVGTYLVDYNTQEIIDCYGIWSKAVTEDFVWREDSLIDTSEYPNKETLMSIRGTVIVDCSNIFSAKKVEKLEAVGFTNDTIDNKNVCKKFVILHVSCDVSEM